MLLVGSQLAEPRVARSSVGLIFGYHFEAVCLCCGTRWIRRQDYDTGLQKRDRPSWALFSQRTRMVEYK